VSRTLKLQFRVEDYPPALQELISHFETLSEIERRESLIDLAESAPRYAPKEHELYDFSDVRKDTECSDTVGIHLRSTDTQRVQLAISLGCQVQTLTRAMSTLLCRGVSGASLTTVAELPSSFVERVVGQQLVQLRARTIYYVLARVKEAAARLLLKSSLQSATVHSTTSPPIDWSTWQPQLRATLMFIVDPATQRVLLIRKKRGLGAGKINGPGGKMDPGETEEQCAIRETQEELHVTPLNPVRHGELCFQFTDGLAMAVGVYRATAWQGEPQETPEAIPLWTALSELPFHEMWADDHYWLREVLVEEKHFIGKFLFADDTMLSHEVTWVAASQNNDLNR
jgi:8-oxo-dGTP diphosphatase